MEGVAAVAATRAVRRLAAQMTLVVVAGHVLEAGHVHPA